MTVFMTVDGLAGAATLLDFIALDFIAFIDAAFGWAPALLDFLALAFIAFIAFGGGPAFPDLFAAFIAFAFDFMALDPGAAGPCLRPSSWPLDDCCFIAMTAFIAVIERQRPCFMAFIAFIESDLSCAGVLALRTEVSDGDVVRRDAEATTECRERVLLCRPRFDRDALAHPIPEGMGDADAPRVEELQEEQMTPTRRR